MQTQTLQNITNPRRLSSTNPTASTFYEEEREVERGDLNEFIGLLDDFYYHLREMREKYEWPHLVEWHLDKILEKLHYHKRLLQEAKIRLLDEEEESDE